MKHASLRTSVKLQQRNNKQQQMVVWKAVDATLDGVCRSPLLLQTRPKTIVTLLMLKFTVAEHECLQQAACACSALVHANIPGMPCPATAARARMRETRLTARFGPAEAVAGCSPNPSFLAVLLFSR
jgi:hypothetical protein